MRRKDRAVTDMEAIGKIIKKCKVCHLAMVDKGSPYVVPLNFGYIIEGKALTLFFHSAGEGRKIDILKENGAVCFDMVYEGELDHHMDNPCGSGYFFESVMGSGNIEFVEDAGEKCKALTLLVKHQANQEVTFSAAQANGVCVYKVVSTDFTAKKRPDPHGAQG